MADNWEDRLAPKIKVSSQNWEDRLKGVSFTPPPNPADGGGTLQFGPFDTGIELSPSTTNFLAGVGKSMTDTTRGIGQAVGMVSRDDVAESRKLDAPLMNTSAGKWGNFAGNVATTLPLMAVPGAGTLKGAATIGAVTGLMQPSTGTAETALNTGLGTAAAPLGNVAGRAIGAGVGMVKGALQPMFASGRSAMIGDLVNRFTPDAATAARNLATNGGELIPGSLPTAAEAANNTGIAQLTKQVQQMSPSAKEAFFQRAQQQNAARVAAVRDISGDPGQREFYDAMRSQAADELYGKARAAGFDPKALTPQAQQNIAAMQARIPPSIIAEAKQLAQIHGIPLDDTTSIEGMHWIKKALDGKIAKESGPSGNPEFLRAYTGLQKDFLNGLENLSPMYKDGRLTYQAMSKPINQMDVGKSLSDTLIPALNDFGASGNLRAAGFTQALRNGDAVARRAVGHPSATMANVLEPEQMQTLNALGQDLARSQNARTLAAAPGSDTAQNLASQNFIKSIVGPLGLPEGMASHTLMQTLAKPAQWLNSLAEPRIMEDLGNTLLSPQQTLKVLQQAQKKGLLDHSTDTLRKFGTPSGLLIRALLADPEKQ